MGKIVIIDILSTRCPHCPLAATTQEQVKERYGDKVAILELVLPPDNQASIANFVETNKVTCVICDQGQRQRLTSKPRPPRCRRSKFRTCS